MPSSNKSYHTTTSAGLTPLPAAQARHHSYALFSRLLLSGLSETLIPTLRAIPDLDSLIPPNPDLDEWAAGHYQLFGMNVFPYESIFGDDSGLLGGVRTQAVVSRFQTFSYTPSTMSESPDHVGELLGALAFLSRQEAGALAAGNTAVFHACQQHQRSLLQAHLLRWLVPLVQAVDAQQDAFYTAVARFTLALAADHFMTLSEQAPQPVDAWSLPQPPSLLDDDKTGLKEIAGYLTTPVYSGVYLSRDVISQLARQYRLPRGFGDRRQTLTNLMRTAVQYDQLSDVVQGLDTAVHQWQLAYQDQRQTYPHLEPFILPWEQLTQRTRRLLSQISNKIEI